MNKLDLDYQNLLQDIIDNGVEKKDRTGVGTISVFGREIHHNMKDGFPLLTTKKMYFKGVVTELIWFLRGDTNIKYLIDNGCNIWNGDAYKKFYVSALKLKEAYEAGDIIGFQPNTEVMFSDSDELIILTQDEFIEKIKNDDEFCKVWGELGPVYGAGWRNWDGIDQIKNLINDLKTNPNSRRLMVNAWNVGMLDQMTLPPCHFNFQIYTEELPYKTRLQMVIDSKVDLSDMIHLKTEGRIMWMDAAGFPKRRISLKWTQRSVDTFLGLPFNIASYGLLLEIIAKEVNMVPHELIGSLGDTHLYINHIEAAREQIGRKLELSERINHMLNVNKEQTENIMKMAQMTHGLMDALNVPTKTRVPFKLPKLLFKDHLKNFKSLILDEEYGVVLRPKDFILDGYKSHDKIEAHLNN